MGEKIFRRSRALKKVVRGTNCSDCASAWNYFVSDVHNEKISNQIFIDFTRISNKENEAFLFFFFKIFIWNKKKRKSIRMSDKKTQTDNKKGTKKKP